MQAGARIRGFAVVLAFVAMLLAARTADAFCGFYVSGADAKLFANASQVVLMREGTRTVLSMQNDYQGPPESFAMVVPVPVVLQKENVKTLPKEIFARVDKLDAPRLVEYWERDPCEPEPLSHRRGLITGPRRAAPAPAAAAERDLGVTIEAQFTVGEYEIVILGAKDSAGLDTWLKREGYKIPEGSEPFLRPYVQQGSKFFVAKVDVTKVKMESGKATLSPLRFHYDAGTFTLPIRLGLVNSPGTQDLIVHVLGKGKRYEVANYPNVTIPTNLDVAENAKERFGTFYAALFDKTIEKTPRAVVTEYAWDAGSCDPCPEPPLTDGELVTLGADVLPSVSSEADLVDPALLKALGTDAGPKGPSPRPNSPSPRRRYYGVSSSFVLTRLHARYTREALGDDLTFKEASAIGGGRELIGTTGTLESGAQASGSNNFQGRYAVRHPWSGPIECKTPVRNRWGGPPNGITNGPAKPALGLAYAPRDNVQFASFLRTDVSELGVKAAGEVPSPVGTYTKPASSVPESATADASGSDGGASGTAPAKSGCGACATGASSSTSGASGVIGAAIAFGAAALRRGRRRSRRGAVVALALAFLLLGARRADAFCGFYVSGADAKLFNNATQVVIMREGTRTVLSMQNNYQGPPEKFAMVVPVPVVLQKENVKTLPAKIFAKVDELTAPRLVEYWEQDPCPRYGDLKVGSGGSPVQGGGKGAGMGALASSPASVTVEAQFTVGEYEIVILSAKDSGGLDAWLKQEGYKIPEGAEPYLRPYVQAGSKFFVARVDVTKVVMKDGNAELSPLRFHYDTNDFTLPMRLGLINSKGTQDLIVNVLASTRTEPANYPSVTIPTNIDIAEGSREHFGRFYTALLDKTFAKTPRAVVTEYAWDARTCDPCPGPTLDGNDFATLGTDVLSGSRPAPRVSPRIESKDPSARIVVARSLPRVRGCQGARFAKNVRPEGTLKLDVTWDPKGKVKKVTVANDDMNDAETTKCVKGVVESLTFSERQEDGSGSIMYAFSIGREDTMRDWTITRMHARYTRDALGADIVFRSAGGIVGGRESTNAQGEIEHGAKPDSINNFQARYIIRHPWTGPIECKEPVRNKWGGPPTGLPPGTSAAKRTAFIPRGGIELASFVRTDVPELGLKAGKGPLTGVPPLSASELALLEPPPASDAGAAPVAAADAAAVPVAEADAGAAADVPKKSGCGGCAMSTEPRISWPIGAFALALALAARRRSRSS